MIPNNSQIVPIDIHCHFQKRRYEPVTVDLKHGSELQMGFIYTSTSATRTQRINVNLTLNYGKFCVNLASAEKEQTYLLLIEYRAP